METALFFIFGGIAVIAAFAMVFNKNAVHSALFLLLNLCMLAGLYILLNAQFIAAIQIMVYAGAIVVLVLFVIMLLGAELGEDIPTWLTFRNIMAVLFGMVLLTITGSAVFEWFGWSRAVQGPITDELIAERGSVELVGQALFTDYLLPFELTSVLLLVGIVGVVVLGGWRKVQHKAGGNE